MNVIKLMYLSLIAALTVSLTANAQSAEKVAIAKKGNLTENELKRWSHLDLDKDSIPGMSVDKVYAELLKGKKGVSVIVGIVGTIGDLIESKFKRIAGVKDSGKIMPGHGGILDRLDSVIFVAPIIFLFYQILNYVS